MQLGELQNDILVRKSDLYQKRSALLEIEFEARLKVFLHFQYISSRIRY